MLCPAFKPTAPHRNSGTVLFAGQLPWLLRNLERQEVFLKTRSDGCFRAGVILRAGWHGFSNSCERSKLEARPPRDLHDSPFRVEA
jgi:hypothetical protein